MTEVIRAKHYPTLYEQSVKDYVTAQSSKIKAEYVRLSKENRQLKADYLAAIEQLQELQMRVLTVSEILKEAQA